MEVEETVDSTPEDQNDYSRFPELVDLEKTWSDYKIKFEKTYKDSAEEEFRKKNFEVNLKMIVLHNERYAKGETTFTMGIMQFSDLDYNTESACGCWRRTSASVRINQSANLDYKTEDPRRGLRPPLASVEINQSAYQRKSESESFSISSLDGSHLDMEEKMDLKPEDKRGYDLFQEVDLEKRWSDYKTEYGKTYKSRIEEECRKKIFEDNLNFFAFHNERYAKGEVTWAAGINQFTDMSDWEFRRPCLCCHVQKFDRVDQGCPTFMLLRAAQKCSDPWRAAQKCSDPWRAMQILALWHNYDL